MDITSGIIYVFLKLDLIRFRLHLIKYIEEFNKHWRIQTYEYIHDKIIHVTKFEILNIYLKTKVAGGILGWIFLWCMVLIYMN